MNTENFVKWQRNQGHRVIRTESSFWCEAGPRTFQAFPYHHLIQPTEKELQSLMLKHGIMALRYSLPFEVPTGMVSYHVVLSNPYNLESLGKSARRWIRQGLKHCVVEPISFERLAGEGWGLQKDTLDRQCRSSSMNESDWRKLCLSADGLPGFEAWGALVEGSLAAALLTSRIGDRCYMLYSLSLRKFLEECYANYAIFYSVSCEMLSRPGINEIFFTVQSLDAPNSVDEFKFRMAFKAIPIRQRVVFHPFLQPFIGNTTFRFLDRLTRSYPNNCSLPKAEGMVRFYLQGQLPLEKQEWPVCLARPAFLDHNDGKSMGSGLAESRIELEHGAVPE